MDTAGRPQVLNTPDVIINPYRFAAGGVWTEDLSDDFAGAETPPSTNWTEYNGSWTITGGIMTVDSSVANRAIIHNTAVGAATQYARVEFDAIPGSPNNDTFDGIVLRHATGNNRYVIRYGQTASQLHFRYCGALNSYTTFHTEGSITISAGDYLMVSVSGTGASTQFDCWYGASVPTKPDGAPNFSVTTDPTTYHDSGTGVGLYAGNTSQDKVIDFDNFSAGSFA